MIPGTATPRSGAPSRNVAQPPLRPGRPMSTPEPLSLPAASRERIEVLDALRGFAILGILVMNLYSFTGWMYVPAGQKAVMVGVLDRAALQFGEVLVRGKFYTIFALLFGIGFAIQRQRGRVDATFLPMYRRRLGVLLAIGLVHLVLLWRGDILALYALCGFLLIPFRNCRDRTLVAWAVVCLLVPVAIYAAMAASGGRFDPGAPLAGARDFVEGRLFPAGVDNMAVLSGGSWGDVLRWNLAGAFDRCADLFREGRLFKVEAVFLLGLWVGRRLKATRSAAQDMLLQRVLIAGLAIGVPGNFVLAQIAGSDADGVPTPIGVMEALVSAVAVVPMGLAYAAGFTLLRWRAGWGRVLHYLAPAGRMALSNYLGQTLIGLSFYGIGFGVVGRIGPGLSAVIALAIFAAQVVVSTMWLRYFQFGPVEWGWRSLTYQRRIPMRVRSGGGAAAGGV